MTSLEDELTEAMKQQCARIKAETELNPSKRLRMINKDCGRETANKLLGPNGEHYWGFQELKKIGRLNLTVECLVLRPAFQPLFTNSQLATARQRLRKGGYDPRKCEQE